MTRNSLTNNDAMWEGSIGLNVLVIGNPEIEQGVLTFILVTLFCLN